MANPTNELLQEISTKLSALHDQGMQHLFLLECCALTLGILWGAATWALFLMSKNEREFF